MLLEKNIWENGVRACTTSRTVVLAGGGGHLEVVRAQPGGGAGGRVLPGEVGEDVEVEVAVADRVRDGLARLVAVEHLVGGAARAEEKTLKKKKKTILLHPLTGFSNKKIIIIKISR